MINDPEAYEILLELQVLLSNYDHKKVNYGWAQQEQAEQVIEQADEKFAKALLLTSRALSKLEKKC